MLLWPGRPAWTWLMLCSGLFVGAMAGLALAAYLGWSRYGWPGEYLQDGEWGTWLSAGPLLAAGLISLNIARRIAFPSRRFWTIAAIGLMVVAGDDLFRGHENLELAVVQLFHLNGGHFLVARINDAVIVGYGILVALFLIPRRRELLQFPWACHCLAAAMLFFTGMAVFDILHWSATIEESLKIAASVLILCALLNVHGELKSVYGRVRFSPPCRQSGTKAVF